jgi:hypothetical protein
MGSFGASTGRIEADALNLLQMAQIRQYQLGTGFMRGSYGRDRDAPRAAVPA